jgi:hypothetical protein
MGHRAMMLNPHGERFMKIVENLRHKLYGDF